MINIWRNMNFSFISHSSVKTYTFLLVFVCISVICYMLMKCFVFNCNPNQSIYSGPAESHYDVFKKLDLNKDGLLTLKEFSAVKNFYKVILLENNENESYEEILELPADSNSQVITITALFKPLDCKSLSKDVQSISHDNPGALEGLFKWSQPFRHQQNFSAKSFALFVPPKNEPLLAGSTWWVIKPIYDKYQDQNLSTKYFPPATEPKFRPLVALLKMFHPRPFLWTRYTPQGTVAILKAVYGDYLDILFRMHAEFQLNEPPRFPFWFTPSQFSGRLIINKNATAVHYFHLHVPNLRKLNVDMEWFNGPGEESMEVDIGYLPEMALLFQSSLYQENKSLTGVQSELPNNMSNSKFSIKISSEDAAEKLEQQFFPFKQVKYYNLTNAFRIAQEESKLVHGVILWGALDDQSC